MKRILFAVFVILVLARACSSGDTPETETGTASQDASQAAPQAAPVAALSVTPESLNLAFREDEQAAEKMYKNKRLIVRGKISTKWFSHNQTPYVAFDIGSSGKTLYCNFPYSKREDVAALFNGQTVEIEGELVLVSSTQIILDDCVLVNARLDPDLHAVMWATLKAEEIEYRSNIFMIKNSCTQALKHEWQDKDKLAYIFSLCSRSWSDTGKTEPALDYADKAIATAPDKPYGYLSKARVYEKDIALYTEWMRKGIERTTDPKDKDRLERTLATAIAESTAIMATSLSSTFRLNEVAAEDQYKGKTLRVKGVIKSIRSLSSGEAELDIPVKVLCIFPKKQRATIAKLRNMQYVVVEGICTGLNNGHVYLKNCRIISVGR